jgi:hypothetical protein
MNLFTFKKIHNSTFFENKTAIIWACRPFWWAFPCGPRFPLQSVFASGAWQSVEIIP